MDSRRHARFFISALLTAGLIHAAQASHPFQTGDVAMFDTNQNIFPSVAIHPANQAFVAAYNFGTGVNVEQWDGAAWTLLTSFTAADTGVAHLGDGLDIVLDANGNVHLACIGFNQGLTPAAARDVIYGFFNAATMTWQFDRVDQYADPGGHINPGSPQVCWNAQANRPEMQWTVSDVSNADQPHHALQYAVRAAANNWQLETVFEVMGAGSALNNAVLKSGGQGVAHSAFMFRPPQNGGPLMSYSIMYGTNSGGAFTFAPVLAGDGSVMPGKALALDVGPGGIVHIAYYDFLNDALRYLTNRFGAFMDEVIDNSPGTDTGRRCQIVVNSKRDVLIAYQDHTNGKLKAAFFQNGGPWHLVDIADDTAQNARFIGAALGTNGDTMILHDAKDAEADKRLAYGVLGPCPEPGIPASVRASNGAFQNLVRITWNPAPNAESYRIYRSNTDSPFTALLIGTTDTTTFDDTTAKQDASGLPAQIAKTNPPNGSRNAILTIAIAAILATSLISAANPQRQPQKTPTRTPFNRAIAATLLIAIGLTATSCIIPHLRPTKHYYWVKSVNECGTASGFSASDTGYPRQIKPPGQN
jgi:hypothetical protein